DSAKLRQVLINLLGNAIKFTEPGGSIKIRLFRKHQGFQIDIEDNGCGIPEEDLGTIFQVFQQAETDNRPHREGTGLGLALVHSLVELIGARISVNSTFGEGSVFTLEIPLLS
ncbi:MAG: ATP-binding protein, partial [SAR324 cluster bacterium]|nr:ATP-binding protein [SAR324 cluster bacterium]